MTPLALGALAASLTLLAAPLVNPSARSPATTRPLITSDASAQPGSVASGAGWPISPPDIIAAFDDPLPYAAGHRGIDLGAHPGQTVTAALPGRVTVAGPVAGRPIIVIEHTGDVRTTYLPVVASVSVGDRVRAGDRIGRVSAGGDSAHCDATPCLHWGARRGESYIDPQSLVAEPAGPIVLLPES